MKRFKGWIAAGLAVLAIGGASTAAAVSWNGTTANGVQPQLLLGTVKGYGDYNRGSTANYNRFQVRLLKNGVQKGSIVTFSAPYPNTTLRGTVNYPCYLGTGNWQSQARGVSISGAVGPWDTSIVRAINCG